MLSALKTMLVMLGELIAVGPIGAAVVLKPGRLAELVVVVFVVFAGPIKRALTTSYGVPVLGSPIRFFR